MTSNTTYIEIDGHPVLFDDTERAAYINWAKKNYTGGMIKPEWHPVLREECYRILEGLGGTELVDVDTRYAELTTEFREVLDETRLTIADGVIHIALVKIGDPGNFAINVCRVTPGRNKFINQYGASDINAAWKKYETYVKNMSNYIHKDD